MYASITSSSKLINNSACFYHKVQNLLSYQGTYFWIFMVEALKGGGSRGLICNCFVNKDCFTLIKQSHYGIMHQQYILRSRPQLPTHFSTIPQLLHLCIGMHWWNMMCFIQKLWMLTQTLKITLHALTNFKVTWIHTYIHTCMHAYIQCHSSAMLHSLAQVDLLAIG